MIHAPAVQLFDAPYISRLLALGRNDVLVATVRRQAGAVEQVVTRTQCSRSDELHVSDRLPFLSLQGDSRSAAIVAPAEVLIFSFRGDAGPARLPLSGVVATAFSEASVLWLLRGGTVYRVEPDGDIRATPVRRRVVGFGLTPQGPAFAEFDERNRLTLCLPSAYGAEPIVTGIRASDLARMRVDLCISGEVAHVIVRPRFHTGLRSSHIERVDLTRRRRFSTVSLGAICHLGLRTIKVQPWRDGSVLVLSESRDQMGLGILHPSSGEPSLLSSPREEVLDFLAEPRSGTICYLGMSVSAPKDMRDLTVLDDGDFGWRDARRHSNVSPAFGLCDGSVIFVEDAGDIAALRTDTRGVLNTLQPLGEAPTSRLQVCRLAADGSWQRRDIGSSDRPLIVLVSGLHKVVTERFQANLMQESLARFLSSLQDSGFDSCALQLPGGSGRGREYRLNASLDNLDTLASPIKQAIESLAAERGRPIGLLSYSLGSLGLLAALGRIDAPIACVLINPVYRSSVIDWPTSFDLIGADTNRCRLLVVHASQDEVAPYQDSVAFTRGGTFALRELVTVEGEGHLFEQPKSFETAFAAAGRFFRQTLASGRRVTSATTELLPA